MSKGRYSIETLFEAAERGFFEVFEDVADVLATRPDIVNYQNEDGETIAHVAQKAGFASISKIIIEQPGFNPDLQDNSGKTVLHYALQNADEETVRDLLEMGARTDLVDADGNTALEIASAAVRPIRELMENHLKRLDEARVVVPVAVRPSGVIAATAADSVAFAATHSAGKII